MATLVAGEDIVLIEPELYWSFRGGTLPNIDLLIDDPDYVPPEDDWTKIIDTMNGVQVTHRNPTVGIFSEERDRIGSVRGQNAGTALAFQALSFTDEFWKFADNMSTLVVTAASMVVTIIFTSGATTDGNLTIGLPGLTPVTVAVTSASQTTAALVATAVRAATFTGWTTGGTGATVTFTKTSTGSVSGNASYNANATGVTVTATYPKITTEGHREFRSSWVDPDEEHHIMLLVFGEALAGGAFDVDTKVVGIAYRAENTQNGVDVFRRTGADAIVKPNIVLEALPEQRAAVDRTGSGIPLEAIDPRGKFNYFDQDLAA